jgi:hypothetical protein
MARAGATRAQARGVTDLAIGSSAWLGLMCFGMISRNHFYEMSKHKKTSIQDGIQAA